MDTVSFTAMTDGTREEYESLARWEMCLVHDIGDMISPANHSQVAPMVDRVFGPSPRSFV